MNKIYYVWANMKQRCLNKKNPRYKDYGGRGITFCKKWGKYKNFEKDMLPTYKKGLTLDRINNDKGYSKSNCRWTDWYEQAQNRRKRPNGAGFTKKQRFLYKNLPKGISQGLVRTRISRGWTKEKSLTTPPMSIRYKFTRYNYK